MLDLIQKLKENAIEKNNGEELSDNDINNSKIGVAHQNDFVGFQ